MKLYNNVRNIKWVLVKFGCMNSLINNIELITIKNYNITY